MNLKHHTVLSYHRRKRAYTLLSLYRSDFKLPSLERNFFKVTEGESRIVAAMVSGEKELGSQCGRYEVSVCEGENVLDMDSGDGCTLNYTLKNN